MFIQKLRNKNFMLDKWVLPLLRLTRTRARFLLPGFKSSSSIRSVSSLPSLSFPAIDKPHEFTSPRSNGGVTLTNQIVRSTLLNCSSDLISLSLFIWSSRQPSYFHSREDFDSMVGVVLRLTWRYGTVNAIVKELEAIGLAAKAGTFLLLLRVYWCGGTHSMVLETLDKMCCFGFTPNTFAYNVIIDIFFRLGNKDGGMKALSEVPSPNFLSYNIALRHVCKANDSVLIRDVLGSMMRNGYYPTSEALEMVLNCFCRVGNLDAAFQVLGLMTTSGIPLSVTIWAMFIDGLRRIDNRGKAFFPFNKMIASTSMKSGMFHKAYGSILKESIGNPHNLVFCNALIHSLIKIGPDEAAEVLFDSMLRSRMTFDSFNICSLLSARGSSKASVLWLKRVSRVVTVQPDLVLYNSLMHYSCVAGCPFLAEWFFNAMIEKGFTPDNYSFAGYLTALFAQGRSDEAVCVYRGLLVSGYNLDAHVHTVVIQCLLQSGKLYEAVDCFQKAVVKNYPLDDVSYTVLIRGLLESGRQEAALDLYDRMKDDANNVSPSVHTYRAMLQWVCEGRDPKRVRKLMEDIVEAAVQLDYKSFMKLTLFFVEDVGSNKYKNGMKWMCSMVILPDAATYSQFPDVESLDAV